MEKYKDMTMRKKSNIKMARNLVFFIGLIIFTFWFVLKDQDLNELALAIDSSNKLYIVIAGLLMFCVFLCEAINVRSILFSLGEKKMSIFKALKLTWIGSFFSAITPAATGGQPVEIYYMTKEGIKGANGTMAMLMQLCGFQISTLVLSIICGIANPSLLKDGIIWFYLLGLFINGFALSIMIICIFSEKISKGLINFNIKMMKKMRIKAVDKIQKKLEDGINQYTESATFIKTHKDLFIKSVLRVFVQITIYHSIPYFIYRSFGLNELNFLQLFSMQSVLYTTVSGIPLPGSIGISETLFLKLYGMAFGVKLLSGAMLLYRFVSFYFYLIVSAIIVVVNAVKMKDVEGEIDKAVKEIEKIKFKDKQKLAYS